jgi:hypothetical protein
MSLLEISGLRPDIADLTTYWVNVGSAQMWPLSTVFPVPAQPLIVVENGAPIVVDLKTDGANGRDTGQMTDGIWYPWVLYNPITSKMCGIGSKQQDPTQLTYPSGFTYFRRLNTGFPMHNGQLDFLHQGAWPQPVVSLYKPRLVASLFGRANWQTINLSAYRPNPARLVLLTIVTSGASGDVFIASGPTGAYDRLCQYAAPSTNSGVRCWLLMDEMYVRVDGPAALRCDVYLDGWEMTDPA